MAAGLDDIALEMGRNPASLTDIERSQLAMWAEDVLALVMLRLPGVDPESPMLARVVRLAVARRAKSPDFGVVSRSVGVDDARVDTRYEGGARADLILPEWWAWLDDGDGSGEAFTILPAHECRRRRRWPR